MEHGDSVASANVNGLPDEKTTEGMGDKEKANLETNITLERMVPPENREKAELMKNDGNVQFRDGHFGKAVELYTEAINLDPYNSVYYSNRSFANLKAEYAGAALQDASRAIELDSRYLKAYYRRATAYLALNKLKEALRDLEIVKLSRPNDLECQRKFADVQKEFQQKQFLKAIAIETPSVLVKLKLDDIVVESSYAGPKLVSPPDPKSHCEVSQHFVDELTDYLKAKQGTNKLHKKYVYAMLLAVKALMEKQPALIDIDVPANKHIRICGDIHGQFFDLLHIFELAGKPSVDNPYLFNGDFVDRGSFSTECIILLIAYKLLLPNHFFLARGNHETDNMNQTYGFANEVTAKYNKDMYEGFCEVFNYLPLSHLINHKVLVMHGGLPTNPDCSISDLRHIDRVRQPPDDGDMCELLWNDPLEAPTSKLAMPASTDVERKASKRGIGYEFSPIISERFCRKNDLEYVIRSHEMKNEGYEVSHDGRVVTIFSAPNYCDQMGNKGAYITLYGSDKLLKPEFKQFSAVPHPKTKNYMSSLLNNMW